MNTRSLHVIGDTAAFDSEESVLFAANLYRQGMKAEAIAAQMGISPGQLRGLMSRNEHRFAGRSERSNARFAQKQRGLLELRGLSQPGFPGGGHTSDETLTELFGRFAAGREDPRLPGEAVTLIELKAWHCRWPVGPVDGAQTLFCGKARALRSYCAEHAQKAGMVAERCR